MTKLDIIKSELYLCDSVGFMVSNPRDHQNYFKFESKYSRYR